MDQWLLVGTRRIVRRTPGGDETCMVCSSADQFAENHLKNNGVDVKRLKLEGRNGILTWKWILEYPDRLWNEGMPTATAPMEIPIVPPPAPPPEEHVPEMRKHLGSGLSGQKSADLPDARHARPLVQGSHTPVNAGRIKMPGKIAAEQDQRRRRDAELLEIRRLDRWTRVRVQQITNPKRSRTTSVTDNDSLANQMDEDNFQRGPATSHQLEPVDDEYVPKKARVARNVFSIRGENGVKFDVNEEAWPNADLAIRATYESALTDGLPADKVKAGDE